MHFGEVTSYYSTSICLLLHLFSAQDEPLNRAHSVLHVAVPSRDWCFSPVSCQWGS